MHWLSKVRFARRLYFGVMTKPPSIVGEKQPAWGRSRELEIITQSSTHSMGLNHSSQSKTGDVNEGRIDGEDEHELEHGRHKRRVTFMPCPGR
jgi:hypothetical protein